MTFGLLAMTLMILTSFHDKSVGLPVSLLKLGSAPAKSDSWTSPLVVRLKDAGRGQPPILYVNSKQVPWQDLDRVLKQELSLRRDWIVYVGGDDAVGWGNVTTVIDMAHGYHAKVFLVTGDAGNATTH
jgi:biopolymer transport protein ExbD